MFLLQRGSEHKGFTTIFTFETEEEMNEYIYKTLEDEKFVSFYMRYWITPSGYTNVDYGSWGDFFRFKEVQEKRIWKTKLQGRYH